MKAAVDRSPLRVVAVSTVLPGGVGSLVFMFRVGRHNPSATLMILFTLWVAAPFAAMWWAARRSQAWSNPARMPFYILILVLTLGSLLIYGNVAFGTPQAKPASMFLLVPLVSLLAIGGAFLIATFASRSPPN